MTEGNTFTAKLIFVPVHDRASTDHTLDSLIRNVSTALHEECLDGPLEFFLWEDVKLILRCKRCGIERRVSMYRSSGEGENNRLAVIKFFLDPSVTKIELLTMKETQYDRRSKVILKKTL